MHRAMAALRANLLHGLNGGSVRSHYGRATLATLSERLIAAGFTLADTEQGSRFATKITVEAWIRGDDLVIVYVRTLWHYDPLVNVFSAENVDISAIVEGL